MSPRKHATRKPTPRRPMDGLRQQAQRISLSRLRQVAPWFLVALTLVLVWLMARQIPTVMASYPIYEVGVKGVSDERRQYQVRAELIDVLRGENYFSVPLNQVYDTVAALTWVDDVSVRREWPGKVLLTVTERRPMAVWNNQSLVANDGEPFEALDKYDASSLPRLNGPDNRLQDVMSLYHSMGRVLSSAGISIEQMDVNARLTARLELSNGVELVVDRDQYINKLSRFVTLLEHLSSREGRYVQRVDLRYSDGMAVVWREQNS